MMGEKCENCTFYGLHEDGHRFVRWGQKAYCMIMGDCISHEGHCSEYELKQYHEKRNKKPEKWKNPNRKRYVIFVNKEGEWQKAGETLAVSDRQAVNNWRWKNRKKDGVKAEVKAEETEDE